VFRGWSGGERECAWRGQVYEALLARGAILAPHPVGCLSTPMTRGDVDTLVEAVGVALRRLTAASGAAPPETIRVG
jgi:glutamate-1-semialdehyde aminotransferase